jgi:hypothetical protein
MLREQAAGASPSLFTPIMPMAPLDEEGQQGGAAAGARGAAAHTPFYTPATQPRFLQGSSMHGSSLGSPGGSAQPSPASSLVLERGASRIVISPEQE